MRLFSVHGKGVVVVPNTTKWTGPWLGATRRPSLQRVANRPILCHVLDAMLEAGILDVAVLAPANATEEISTCISKEGPAGLSVSHLAVEPSDSGEQGLAAAARFAGGDACVIHRANGLLGQPLEPFLRALEAGFSDALLLVQDSGREASRLKLVPQRPLGDTEDDATLALAGAAGVCLLASGAFARATSAEPAKAPHPAHAPEEAHVLEDAEKAPEPECREQVSRERCEHTLDLATLARRLAHNGAHVRVGEAPRWRSFDGDAVDLLDLNRSMLDRLDPELTLSSTDGNRFEGPIDIHPTAHVSSSVIIGPVLIGADALIADSYIGPHTSIGERVRIEGAELERSIVLADASVLHVGGRLVASVVGRQARIFRDFSMPRALRLQVGDGDEVALC